MQRSPLETHKLRILQCVLPRKPQTTTIYKQAQISQSWTLTLSCLAGQFLNHEVKLLQESLNTHRQEAAQNQTEPLKANPTNTLKVKGRLVPVVWKQRRIYNGQQEVNCWFAKNNADKLIDGSYKDYLASHPFDTGTSFGTINSL